MIRLFLLTISLGIACGVGADVISFQDPATGNSPYAAEVFEDPQFYFLNCYQLDDLELGPDGYYLESAVTYWYCWSRFDQIAEPQRWRLRTYSDLPDSYGDIDQYFIKEYYGVSGEYDDEGRWAVTIDLEGDLYSGTIWIAAYLFVRYGDDQFGAWWNANAENLGYETNGSEEYHWMWGSYIPPQPGSWFYGITADMSWKIEGTPIPEPVLLSLVAATALLVGSLHRRWAER